MKEGLECCKRSMNVLNGLLLKTVATVRCAATLTTLDSYLGVCHRDFWLLYLIFHCQGFRSRPQDMGGMRTVMPVRTKFA